MRPALESDSPSIRALIHQAQINPTGLDWRHFIVAVDGQDRLLGCGQTKQHKDGSRELASIAVAPEWRRQGVASHIIHHLLAKNPGKLYLTCRASLGTFYERFGFHIAKPEEMTPYYRRLAQLARTARFLHLVGGEMLVMVRES